MRTEAISKHQHRGYAWLWLCYTGFLFIDPLMEPSLRLWLGTLAVFAIFVLIFYLYMQSSDSCRPLRFWMIGATFILGLLTFPWNGGGSCLFVYTAAFLPFAIRSVPRVLQLFVVESLSIVAEHYLFPHPGTFYVNWPNALIAIFLLLLIGGGNIFFAQQTRADSKLRMAHEEIEALAAVAERERIARDLHDVLGHTLSLIVLKAELANRLIAIDPQRAAVEIADVERTARTALAEVREAIGGYRARGLAAEIENARRTLDSAGVTLILESLEPTTNAGAPGPASGTWIADTPLTAAEETVLALALREAVTNIVRHARAKTCRLRFVSDSGHRRLVVEDDGEHPLAREGNGLRGMRERVEALGGHISLQRDHGTRLLIELPHHTETAA
jgi:two-component system sensor histidine kinase DesK